MIQLSSPYWYIDGMTVLSDHEDESLYYVLPVAPHLCVGDDGTPAFSLTQFLGGGAGDDRIEGGLLNLTTELRVSEEALGQVREKLAAQVPNAGVTVRVSPVLFESGDVEIMALGSRSAADDRGRKDDPASGPFDITILGSGKCSLDARNTSSFQLLVDAHAAQLIEACLEDPVLPIVVVYRLKFAGLRPSYHLNVTADWSKVYRMLEQRASVNAYFVKTDVDVAVREAIERQDIDVEMTVTATDDEGKAAAAQARQQVVEWVLDNLCQPMIPKDQGATVSRVAEDVLGSLVRTVVPGVSYRLRALSESQLRTISASMNQASAVLQEIVPQGTLGSMLHRHLFDEDGERKADADVLTGRLVSKVNLDGFPRLEVNVGVEDRFAEDGVSTVIVDVARAKADGNREDPTSYSFRDAATSYDYIVNLLGKERAAFPEPYHYRTEVRFDPAHDFGAHDPLQSDWLPGRTTQLVVEPRSTYALREVALSVSPVFSFQLYPAVEIEIEYEEEDGAPQRGRVVLDRETQTAVWRYRAHTLASTCFTYSVTYHRPPGSGAGICSGPKTGCSEWIVIDDPLPRKRQLTLVTALPWDQVTIALVRVRYEDKEHDIEYDEDIDITSDCLFIRRDYAIAEEGHRRIKYRLSVLLTDGRFIDGSWRETEAERIVVDRTLIDEKAVRIQCIGDSLEEAKLSAIRVHLQVRHGQEVRHEAERVINPGEEAADHSWAFVKGDPPELTVHFMGEFVTRDGFVSETDWDSTQGDSLVVRPRARTISG